MKHISKSVPVLALSFVLSCSNDSTKTQVYPVEFPSSVDVSDFQFPEDQDTVYGWLANRDETKIGNHAWGIWSGLTQETNQSHNGQNLRVFETWMGVGELSNASALGDRSFGCSSRPDARVSLKTPKQFLHAGEGLVSTPEAPSYSILETVAYSPSAACFATSNLLFNKSVLESFRVKGGIGKVPSFPLNSIITKPTYYVTQEKAGLVKLPVWISTPNPAKEFGYKTWTSYIYVDLDNNQAPGKLLTPIMNDNPTPEEVEAGTCNRSDFINFTLDAQAADYLNKHQDRGEDPSRQFHAGSVALLVGMHVTTKETENWTWQTYYWTPDPMNPGEPSSPEMVDSMPISLDYPANHYAVSSAYSMVWPNQPVTGGTDVDATPSIAFNPYLEAGFGPKVFAHENLWRPDFTYGVQTNCASCHALATYGKSLGYSTNQYIDMRDPAFKDTVQLDFAWSIVDNLNEDK